MKDLRTFYRILGIAEHIIEPSYYHLLGVDRKDCSEETVRTALRARKNELRQNIPGPEFVPLIVDFEKNQLEPAAAVLADDIKRAEYDKTLAARWAQIKNETEQRSRLIGSVRMEIANAIDQNGTLNRKGKDALGEKLKQLGVEEHNIAMILDRIPFTLFETGEFGEINADFFDNSVVLAADEGNLDQCDKTNLLALAERLNIDKQHAQAAIEECTAEKEQPAPQPQPDESEPLHLIDLQTIEGEGGDLINPAIADKGEGDKVQLVTDPIPDEFADVLIDPDQQPDALGLGQSQNANAADDTGVAFTVGKKRTYIEIGRHKIPIKYIIIAAGIILLGVIVIWLTDGNKP